MLGDVLRVCPPALLWEYDAVTFPGYATQCLNPRLAGPEQRHPRLCVGGAAHHLPQHRRDARAVHGANPKPKPNPNHNTAETRGLYTVLTLSLTLTLTTTLRRREGCTRC
eukprot:scaffold5279_cov54-Phaeocystis_antarctica.AAC.1